MSLHSDTVSETYLPSQVQLSDMITGDLRNKVENLWDTFRSGGISNPITIVEQIYEMVVYRPVAKILNEGEALEGEIALGISELKGLLRE